MDDDKKPKNPLLALWNIFATIGGIISLASMAETWAGDLLKLRGFIGELISLYRSIVHPVFEILFGWLPINFSTFTIDYYMFGIIIVSAFGLAGGFPINKSIDDSVDKPAWLVLLFIYIFGVWVWPLVLLITGVVALGGKDINLASISGARLTLQWIGVIVLGFIILLIINNSILTHP